MSRNQSRPRIAIVVNDGPLLNALAFMLEADGWEAAAFRKPADLLKKLPRAQCLLVDHNLPGMDGLALIAAARAAGMTAPAVIIAGKAAAPFRKRASDAGVEIVDKPLVGDDLKRRIRAALDGV
jgi:two-component system response regulator FixJ